LNTVASRSDLAGQIDDAKAFQSEYEEELRRLISFPGVDGVELDFPIHLRIGTVSAVVARLARSPARA
jgi:hypothetical protein